MSILIFLVNYDKIKVFLYSGDRAIVKAPNKPKAQMVLNIRLPLGMQLKNTE